MPPAQSLTAPSDRLNLPWNDSLPQPAELTAEIQRLCRAGETDPVGTILARYPELLADRPLIVDLIYEEYLERKKAGGMADAEAFCRRFPAYERSLRAKWPRSVFWKRDSLPLAAISLVIPE